MQNINVCFFSWNVFRFHLDEKEDNVDIVLEASVMSTWVDATYIAVDGIKLTNCLHQQGKFID